VEQSRLYQVVVGMKHHQVDDPFHPFLAPSSFEIDDDSNPYRRSEEPDVVDAQREIDQVKKGRFEMKMY
jgi:hypothetical protein